MWLPIQINYFYTWCGRFASQHNYDKLSRIFSCILLTHNHTIFHVRFGINKQLLIFSKTTNCSRPTGWWNFVSLWKFYLCLLVPNCTLNHVITYKKICNETLELRSHIQDIIITCMSDNHRAQWPVVSPRLDISNIHELWYLSNLDRNVVFEGDCCLH